MTDRDRDNALAIINWFSEGAFNKYARGVEEHGGELPLKGGLLHEAEMECLDHAIYLRTVRGQLERVMAALAAGNGYEAHAALRAMLEGTPEDRLRV